MDDPNTTIQNPAIKPGQLDDFDQRLLKAAGYADRGEEIPKDLLVSEDEPTEKPVEEDTAEPSEAAKLEEGKPERARDPITGQFIKTDAEIAEQAKTEAVEPQAKPKEPLQAEPESEYAAKLREKKEKEEARLEKSRSKVATDWEEINRQKDEIEQERQRIAREKEALRQPARQARPFTSKQLFDGSQGFKAEAKQALEVGDYDKFNEKMALADKTFENAAQFYELEQQEAAKEAQDRHQLVWENNIKEAFKTEPELADTSSPLSNEVRQILETSGKDLWMFEDGFQKAVEIAKLRIKASGYEAILEANKKLKADNDRLNGLSAIKGSGPTYAPSKKAFDDMTSAEQDAYLMRMAAEADAGR